MEAISTITFVIALVAFAHWILEDKHADVAFAIAMIALIISIVTSPEKEKKIVSIQEIEYAINKCSSFGGLKEIYKDSIVCMDKTKITMDFKPETKVEEE